MTAIGFLLVGSAGPAWLPVEAIGWWGLWIAAVLTLVTGWDYLQAGLRHMLQDRRGSRAPSRPPSAPERRPLTGEAHESPLLRLAQAPRRLRRGDGGAAAGGDHASRRSRLWLAERHPGFAEALASPAWCAARSTRNTCRRTRRCGPATRWRSFRR